MNNEPDRHIFAVSGHPAAGDEISLVDMVTILFRQRWVILAVTALVVALGLAYAVFAPTRYNTFSIIELGQTLDENEYRHIEAAAAVKIRLESASQALANQWATGNSETLPFSPDRLKISAPKEGTLITLELPSEKSPKTKEFLNALGTGLVEAHSRVFSQKRESIQSSIEDNQLQIENIDNRVTNLKNEFDIEKLELQSASQKLEGDIESAKSQIAKTEKQVQLLEQERQDLEKRINLAQENYQNLSESKLAANNNASSDSAISLILFSNDIMQTRRHLEDLRDRALFKIPEQQAGLQTRLKELQTDLQGKQASLIEARTRLEQLPVKRRAAIEDMENQKKSQLLKTRTLQNQLDNMITTRVITKPTYSSKPVAPNTKLIVALAMFLGGCLGVFTGFGLEFWLRYRDQITGKEEGSRAPVSDSTGTDAVPHSPQPVMNRDSSKVKQAVSGGNWR